MRLKKLCALLLTVVLTLGLCSCSIGKKGKYEKAVEAVRNGRYQEAIESLEALDGYEDSAKYIIYARALQAGDSGDYENAVKALEAVNGFEKSAVYITSYTTLAYEAEQARMKSVYNQAIADVKAGNYDAAIAAFETLNDYEDSSKYIMYARCLKTGDSGDYDTAIKSLTSMGDFKEAGMYIKYYTALAYEASESYEKAAAVYDEILLFKDVQTRVAALPDKILDRERDYVNTLISAGQYVYAIKVINDRLSGDKDSVELLNECNYQLALETEAGGAQNAQQAYNAFKALGTYKDSARRVAAYETKYNDAVSKEKAGEFDVAIALFAELGNYSDSSEWVIEAQNAKAYAAAASLMDSEKYEEAIEAFKELNGYKDSETQITECTYLKAEMLRKNGKYKEAYVIYRTILEYKNVTEIMQSDEGISAVVAYVNGFQAGNYVTFGSYPQTEAGNDNTPIEWLVLENDGETALLISRYALDCKPYDEKQEDTTWEKCTLRGWLNNEFFNNAFSVEEKQSILQSEVSADKNPKYSTNPGNATKDKVFLLSIVEANKYFKRDDARRCASTDYAIQQGVYTSDSCLLYTSPSPRDA